MTFKKLVDKLMTDKSFYKSFKKDPEAALAPLGTQLDEKQIKALKKVDFKRLEKVAKAFNDKVT